MERFFTSLKPGLHAGEDHSSMASTSLSPPMRLLLNKRFTRIGLLCVGTFLIIFLTGLWRPENVIFGDSNGVGLMGPPSSLFFGSRTRPKSPEFYPFETTSSFFPVAHDIQGKTAKELCSSFPNYLTAGRVQPVLKMGHGERRDKVEAQLDSVSACFTTDELLVFSDLDEIIRDRAIIDILADLPEQYRVENPDFDNYLAMQDLRRNGRLDIDKNATAAIDGWRLDKYKFLPIVVRAWNMRPDRDFYVFYETDTYVFWDNMFRFLGTFDPDEPLYMGSPSPGMFDDKKGVKTWFANGGPGFVLSRGAIKKLLHREAGPTGRYIEQPVILKWLDMLRKDCCGDSVMGWTLWNISIPLSGYWPLFNPHSLHGIPYSEPYWCQPVLTLHKTAPSDMVDLWRWEQSQRKLNVSRR
jgi:hypothetical protein